MCTGSGAIALVIKRDNPSVLVTASDKEEKALMVAKQNAEENNLQVEFVSSDLFENINGEFDIIVSNPPYIKSQEILGLMEEVRMFEPVSALDGHEDGLYFYGRIARESCSYLKAGGRLYLEIGWDQGQAVPELLREQGFQEIEVKKDLAGLDRVVTGVLRN